MSTVFGVSAQADAARPRRRAKRVSGRMVRCGRLCRHVVDMVITKLDLSRQKTRRKTKEGRLERGPGNQVIKLSCLVRNRVREEDC
jgi:hypothetical protein